MLPQLRKLEHAFPEGLAVIGVHSGKFIAERKTERIRAAAERLRIDHPIVNDRQFRVWRSFAVSAWPTLAIVDASGYVVAQQPGEIPAESLVPLVERLFTDAEAAGILDRSPLPFPHVEIRPSAEGADAASESMPQDASVSDAKDGFRFPEGIAVDAISRRLFVADSGRDRIVALRLDGEDPAVASLEWIAGGSGTGFRDGNAEHALFEHPRGLAFANGRLWVADTGNHAVRFIDAAAVVETAAGTGRLSRTFRAAPGIAQDAAATLAHETDLRSPWHMLSSGQSVFVAMAGSHQIWRLDLRTGRIAPWTGSGAEAVEDGPPEIAALAQPSSLAVLDASLYFADSESSAIRWAGIADARVHTVIGTGLFDFGDRDGTGDHVRLQHPLAIAADNRDFYIADTYNDRIKKLDVAARKVTTWLAESLFEPSALALTPTHLYIADTNHHRIMVADRATSKMTPLTLKP